MPVVMVKKREGSGVLYRFVAAGVIGY